jgi:oxygen-independent coproporphyrinogen-3 oxidase
MEHAHVAGAASVSADIIYGLPGADAAQMLRSLREVVAAGVHHLSLYALTVSEGARILRVLRESGLELPGEDEVADQYLAACAFLDGAGFRQYEISNFCLPGHHGRHNLGYWTRDEYLGVGAGAHSLLGDCRFHNPRSILAYSSAMRAGRPACEGLERLDAAAARGEEIMLGLRTALGVDEVLLGSGKGLMDDLVDLGLLSVSGGRARLTRRGMLVSNAVIADLLPA